MMKPVLLLCLLAAAVAAPAAVECYHWRPTDPRPLLPDLLPERSIGGEGLTAQATPGEVVSLSWAVRSDTPVEALEFAVSLPGLAWDLRMVKVWYQSGSAWRAIEQDKSRRVLVPELLLRDPELVRVDHAAETNYLRVGDGAYRPIGDPADNLDTWTLSWPTVDGEPRDAATLRPFPLEAETSRQLWLTVRVPEEAAPGVYPGSVTLLADGVAVRELPLTLTVLPFRLAEPRTRHDPKRPFVSSLYHLSLLRNDRPYGDLSNYYRDGEQYAAELRNLRDHGVTNPLINQLMAEPLETLEASFAEVLRLRAEAGLENRPLYILTSPSFYFGEEFGVIDAALAGERAETIAGWVEKYCGHREVFFYGFDEAKGETLSMQREVWMLLHRRGFGIFASGYTAETAPPGNFALVGDILDILVCALEPSREEAALWHAGGRAVWNYANPQSGVENPAVYRLNYGLKLYFADYDGAADFCYHHAFGDPWNDFDSPHWRDHNFVYPTADGVVDTIAWEGYREGITDLRYASTLRLAIAAAGGTDTAMEAEAWLEGLAGTLEPESDLDAVRRGMAAWIMALDNPDGK